MYFVYVDTLNVYQTLIIIAPLDLGTILTLKNCECLV